MHPHRSTAAQQMRNSTGQAPSFNSEQRVGGPHRSGCMHCTTSQIVCIQHSSQPRTNSFGLCNLSNNPPTQGHRCKHSPVNTQIAAWTPPPQCPKGAWPFVLSAAQHGKIPPPPPDWRVVYGWSSDPTMLQPSLPGCALQTLYNTPACMQ
jgi:hypothetical protein